MPSLRACMVRINFIIIASAGTIIAVASPGRFQGFLETSQAPTIAYSTVQLARYSFGATGTELSL